MGGRMAYYWLKLGVSNVRKYMGYFVIQEEDGTGF